MSMTVEQLTEFLEEMDQDAEVRIAEIGFRSRFEYAIDDLAEVVVNSGMEGEETVVYLAQGGQLDYLPTEATEALGG